MLLLHMPKIGLTHLRLQLSAYRCQTKLSVSVGFRLGSTTCQPHTSICGTTVDARALHRFSCRKSTPSHIRHAQLNGLIWRAVKKVQILATKEPIDLLRTDGKRPDGASVIPWVLGKPSLGTLPSQTPVPPPTGKQMSVQVQHLPKRHQTRLTNMPVLTILRADFNRNQSTSNRKSF